MYINLSISNYGELPFFGVKQYSFLKKKKHVLRAHYITNPNNALLRGYPWYPSKLQCMCIVTLTPPKWVITGAIYHYPLYYPCLSPWCFEKINVSTFQATLLLSKEKNILSISHLFHPSPARSVMDSDSCRASHFLRGFAWLLSDVSWGSKKRWPDQNMLKDTSKWGRFRLANKNGKFLGHPTQDDSNHQDDQRAFRLGVYNHKLHFLLTNMRTIISYLSKEEEIQNHIYLRMCTYIYI